MSEKDLIKFLTENLYFDKTEVHFDGCVEVTVYLKLKTPEKDINIDNFTITVNK